MMKLNYKNTYKLYLLFEKISFYHHLLIVDIHLANMADKQWGKNAIKLTG